MSALMQEYKYRNCHYELQGANEKYFHYILLII